MGRYDDITPERLRTDLVAFARLILRLDREDAVLTSPADIQKLLGELRQKLFAYEVRAGALGSGQSGPPGEPDTHDPSGTTDEPDPTVRESLKVVRDAIRRSEEMLHEWDGTLPEEADPDE